MDGAVALVHPWGTPVVGGLREGEGEGVSERGQGGGEMVWEKQRGDG